MHGRQEPVLLIEDETTEYAIINHGHGSFAVGLFLFFFLLLKVSSQLNVHYQKKAQLSRRASPQIARKHTKKEDKPVHCKAAHFVPDTIIKLLH